MLRHSALLVLLLSCLLNSSGVGSQQDREGKLREWRLNHLPDAPPELDTESQGDCLQPHFQRGILVAELRTGGLSNRREGLLHALRLAKILNRSLVVSEEWDPPLAASFGPCFPCVRPFQHYFNLTLLHRMVPILGYEELFEVLENQPSVRAVCKGEGSCLASPPEWIRSSGKFSGEITYLQSRSDFQALKPLSDQQLSETLGPMEEQVLWIDSGFRITEAGGWRRLLEGGEGAKRVSAVCNSCLSACHSTLNPHVRKESWCDPACRVVCEDDCIRHCAISNEHILEHSKLQGPIPIQLTEVLQHLSYTNHLWSRARNIMHTILETVSDSGQDEGAEFVCAHWRRDDWSFPLSPKVLIDGIKASSASLDNQHIRDENGRIKLFLATDATDEQRSQVAKEFLIMSACKESETGCPLLSFGSREEEWNPWEFDSVEGAILEQLVCAQAVLFVGTRLSTFSETIVQERIRLGYPLASNFLIP